MKTTLLPLFFILSLSIGCSNRAERDRALQDLEQTEKELLHNNLIVEQLKADLNNSILELEVAKDKLQQVKQFQLMRTESEREQQIKTATQQILDIQKYNEGISSRIEIVADSILYDEREILRLKELIEG
jgi:hypothetical protein